MVGPFGIPLDSKKGLVEPWGLVGPLGTVGTPKDFKKVIDGALGNPGDSKERNDPRDPYRDSQNRAIGTTGLPRDSIKALIGTVGIPMDPKKGSSIGPEESYQRDEYRHRDAEKSYYSKRGLVAVVC